MITRSPTLYSLSRPSPSASITPTGSWPRIRPGRTGYSPLTMCTSVPQIVVAVMRMTASPARGLGFGTSSIRRSSIPLKTTAFIFSILLSPSLSQLARIVEFRRRCCRCHLATEVPACRRNTVRFHRVVIRAGHLDQGEFSPARGTISRLQPDDRATQDRGAMHARWARTLAPVLLALIFWIDTLSPIGVAVHALYVVPALVFIRSGRFWEPLLVAFVASALTIGGFNLSPPGGSVELGRINVPLELLIVWISA